MSLSAYSRTKNVKFGIQNLFSMGNPIVSRAKTYFDPKGIFLAPTGARGPQMENQLVEIT